VLVPEIARCHNLALVLLLVFQVLPLVFQVLPLVLQVLPLAHLFAKLLIIVFCLQDLICQFVLLKKQ
jgi:hypothetical protein